MAMFTIIADHDYGGSGFCQVRAESAGQALASWAESLGEAQWQRFSSAHQEQILNQMDRDALQEDVAAGIDGCRLLWRQDYVLYPEEKVLRVLVVKTAES